VTLFITGADDRCQRPQSVPEIPDPTSEQRRLLPRRQWHR